MKKEVSCCLTLSLWISLFAWGLLDLVTPEVSQTFKLAPERVCADKCLRFYTLIRSILPFPVLSWQLREKADRGLSHSGWVTYFPNLCPAGTTKSRCSWRSTAGRSLILWHSWGSGGALKNTHWHSTVPTDTRAPWLPVPPSDPTLGPPSFCLFFIRHMFIECLLCTRDCSKFLAYISERNAQTALASCSLRSKVPILLKGLMYLA